MASILSCFMHPWSLLSDFAVFQDWPCGFFGSVGCNKQDQAENVLEQTGPLSCIAAITMPGQSQLEDKRHEVKLIITVVPSELCLGKPDARRTSTAKFSRSN